MNDCLNESKARNILAEVLAVSEELNHIKDLDSLLDRVLLEARRFSHADAGSIFLAEGDQLKFSFVQNDTLFKNNANNKLNYSNRTIPISEKSIAGYAAMKGEAVVIDDAYHIAGNVPYKFNTSFDEASQYRTTAVLTVPLKTSKNKTVGVLQVINAKDPSGAVVPFSAESKLYVTYFANNAAVAIERAVMTREIILRMLRMSELRDPKETGAHVNRVGAYSTEIYQRWAVDHGVGGEEIKRNKDLLRLAAMMHDVGKVAISDLILKKPGRFTDEEREIMKYHAIYGAQLFRNASSELDVMSFEIALNHHERWDGQGYPGKIENLWAENVAMGPGKAKDEPPVWARIVALADVFDALSSKRVYKDAWTQDQVLAEIKKSSGTQFDPAVVESFLSIYDVIEAIFQKYTE